jgi:hypothetical protein
VVDPRQVEERERAAQTLCPPPVSVSGDRLPVEERVPPVLAAPIQLVWRGARDEAVEEQLRMGAVVDAVLGDIDRHVPEQAHAPLARVRAERPPLPGEADLVLDAPPRRLPVVDPVRIRAPERRELALRHGRVRLCEEPVPGGERGGRRVR